MDVFIHSFKFDNVLKSSQEFSHSYMLCSLINYLEGICAAFTQSILYLIVFPTVLLCLSELPDNIH